MAPDEHQNATLGTEERKGVLTSSEAPSSPAQPNLWALVQGVRALCEQPPETLPEALLRDQLQKIANLCGIQEWERCLEERYMPDDKETVLQAMDGATSNNNLDGARETWFSGQQQAQHPVSKQQDQRTETRNELDDGRAARLLQSVLQAIRFAGRGVTIQPAIGRCLAALGDLPDDQQRFEWPPWVVANLDNDGGANFSTHGSEDCTDTEHNALEKWLDALERYERRLSARLERFADEANWNQESPERNIERRAVRLYQMQRNLRRALLNEMYLLVAPVKTEAIAMQYRQPRDLLAEYGITSEATERGALLAVSRRAARQRENEKLAYQRHRAEQEERRRARHARYLESLLGHGKSFRDARVQVNQERQALNRAIHKYFRDRLREEERRARREELERIRALRANDEEAYLRMLDATKNSRIMEVLRQTENYLSLIATKVQAQKDLVGVNEAVDAQGLVGLKAREATRKAQVAQRRQLREQERRMKNESGASPEMDGEEEAEEEAEAPAKNMLDAMRRRRDEYYQLTHSIGELVEEQPSSLRGGQLKPYQIEGLQWMVSLYNNNLNGILADEMGLGKTIQTIALLAYLMEYKEVQGPHLIVVPLSTLSNWVREFRAWAPHMKMVVYRGDKSARRMIQQYEMASGRYNVLLTTYEYCVRDQRALSRIFWKYIIVDEGHRMKNTHCRLAMTLGVKYRSRNRLLLTGTPLQNNLTELWALLNFLLPNIFSSVDTFESWFSTPFQSLGTNDQPELTEEEVLLIINRLHHVLRPFLLRRLKTDVEDQLPEKREHVLRCDLSIWQKILYRQAKSNIGVVLNAGGKPRLFNNVVMQLKKVCNHPYLFYDWEEVAALDPLWIVRTSGKFELLDRMLPKLRQSGHRVLLFSQMTILLDVLEDFCKLRNFSYLRLDGSTKAEERHEMLELFNAPDNDIFLFMLSTRAGGLGLNLQSADTVILFDSDWNPQADLQAQDRAHRIGQRNEVRVFRLICADTVEERILAEANRKLNMDRQVIQAGKFNQKATDQERRAMLEELLRQQEGNEAAADVPDDETLNELLARTEGEVELFERIDAERRSQPELYPPLLTDGNELPDWVRMNDEDDGSATDGFAAGRERGARRHSSDADDTASLETGSRHRRAARSRTVLYDDGLTEGEWLRLLERGKTADEFERAIRERRRRKELKRMRYQETVRRKRRLLRGLNPDDTTSESASSADSSAQPTELNGVGGSSSSELDGVAMPAGSRGASATKDCHSTNPLDGPRPRGRPRGRPPKNPRLAKNVGAPTVQRIHRNQPHHSDIAMGTVTESDSSASNGSSDQDDEEKSSSDQDASFHASDEEDDDSESPAGAITVRVSGYR
jgi:SNF2 family DNA or RNA helicase